MTAIVGVEPGCAGRCSGNIPDHSACRVCRRPSRWTRWSGSRLLHWRLSARMRIEEMPVSTPTPEMHGGNFARKGFPTARLPERGLRDNQANKPPWSLRT
jgi:hypothetical protein